MERNCLDCDVAGPPSDGVVAVATLDGLSRTMRVELFPLVLSCSIPFGLPGSLAPSHQACAIASSSSTGSREA
ncbi:hypothetical protein R1flu_018201 [Riccia fluitans]|uniref:Uncharacterized protein n=1 Tax=Riccia fluitans TaxID=41844 RepID=A0ABD1ZFC4_9MARC